MGKIIIKVTDRKNKKHILEGQKGQTLMQLIDQNNLKITNKILKIKPAEVNDGGEGAFYLLLKNFKE